VIEFIYFSSLRDILIPDSLPTPYIKLYVIQNVVTLNDRVYGVVTG